MCIRDRDIVALQLLFALWVTHRDNQILDNGCLCICTFEGNSCNKLWHIIDVYKRQPQEYVDIINKFGGKLPDAVGIPEEQLTKASEELKKNRGER